MFRFALPLAFIPSFSFAQPESLPLDLTGTPFEQEPWTLVDSLQVDGSDVWYWLHGAGCNAHLLSSAALEIPSALNDLSPNAQIPVDGVSTFVKCDTETAFEFSRYTHPVTVAGSTLSVFEPSQFEDLDTMVVSQDGLAVGNVTFKFDGQIQSLSCGGEDCSLGIETGKGATWTILQDEGNLKFDEDVVVDSFKGFTYLIGGSNEDLFVLESEEGIGDFKFQSGSRLSIDMNNLCADFKIEMDVVSEVDVIDGAGCFTSNLQAEPGAGHSVGVSNPNRNSVKQKPKSKKGGACSWLGLGVLLLIALRPKNPPIKPAAH